jgi:hypothetical protein
MQFDEKKADEIIKKFNLDEKTVKVWRTRGKIPDRYADSDYKVEKRITGNADKVTAERILSIIQSNEINASTITELAGIANMVDIQRGKSTLTEEQLISIKKEINRLKVDIKNALNQEYLFKKIIVDKRIKYYPILRYSFTDSEIKQLIWQAEKSFIERDLLQRAKEAFIVFLFKLNI